MATIIDRQRVKEPRRTTDPRIIRSSYIRRFVGARLHKPSAMMRSLLEPFDETWPKVFWTLKGRSLPLVCVDDFKVVVRASERGQIWKELKGVIEISAEKVEERFFGCRYTNCRSTASSILDMLKQHPSYHRPPHVTKEDCKADFPE